MAKGGEVTKSDTSSVPLALCFMCNKPGDLDWVGRCEPCFRAYLDNPTGLGLPLLMAKVQLTNSVSASAAHIKDIKSRRLADDGKTTIRQKPNATYFTR